MTYTLFPPHISLAQASTIIDREIADGNKPICPCCDRAIAVRTERLNWVRVHMLVAFCHYNPDGWMHKDEINELFRTYNVAPDTNIGSGDFAKNAYWGLIREATVEDLGMDHMRSGMWKMTQVGRDFVHGIRPMKPAMKYYNRAFVEWTKRPSAFVQELVKKDRPLDETLTPKNLSHFFTLGVDESI